MKATSIPAHEASFLQTGIDAGGKKFKLTPGEYPIKGTTEKISLIDCVPESEHEPYYYKEITPKKKIILHFTMGYLKGDILTLTKDHVSVPFVIGRKGDIFNLFASKYWSYHLGPGAIGGNTTMSRESIGIEISNIGPLKKIGNNLVTTYSNSDVYCTLDETQFYCRLPKKYRGHEYYATYTDAQYKSVIKLLKFLCAKYDIPKTFVTDAVRFDIMTANNFTRFSGIASHVNCRSDKCDIGPAFDWQRVITGVL